MNHLKTYGHFFHLSILNISDLFYKKKIAIISIKKNSGNAVYNKK